ncbi:magnesium chelatase subunit D [Polymorphobacter megasporae]|uniref:magnesium chelatase subunit D n=1 Tax=Glacieibacterium megasporae TaxID=2835787 RepID=UPI001C1E1D84|nr:magnesium chelatase subunit D [Polymorphobacter megasporae]UAJ09966.1 magnesium chelatase subunit D [Polymorphobacter megasporae]
MSETGGLGEGGGEVPPAAPDRWADALLAARLLAADPLLGGIVVRSAAGPARDAWLEAYRSALPSEGSARIIRRIPTSIDDERLLGGLDLAATLSAGRPIVLRGVLAEADGGTIVVPMAERIDTALAGKLAAVIDAGEVAVERDGVSLRLPARVTLVLLDEGIDDEAVPAALAERCGLWLDLAGVAARSGPVELDGPDENCHPRERGDPRSQSPATLGSRVRGDDIKIADSALETLVATALAFGVDSARATLFALRAARGFAALAGRAAVEEDDVVTAARLILMPRATRMPAPPEAEAEEPPPPQDTDREDGNTDSPDDNELTAQTDIVVEAVRAALPPGLLAALSAGTASAGKRGGAGAKRKAATRGRPSGSRAGTPGAGQRLALIDTIRAAAPWQKLRRAGAEGSTRVIVRRDDFRIRRFVERAESTTIFAVDASGSAAIARLAESKGAVELLLAEAYVKRTQVALIAFRGAVAEVILPPTRSLARAKRCLADMAGGGGTPLAAGLDAAFGLARAAKSRGRTPFVVVLTDGRANIARDGTASRERAGADALTVARGFVADRIAAAFIDTSPRPRLEGAGLAAAMGARYAPLPAAGAVAMAGVVRALTQ